MATWLTTVDTATVRSSTAATVSAAAGKVPQFVLYAIPNRDCGGASAGGAANLSQWSSWVGQFAQGLGSSTAIVVLEPDSLALQTCLSSADATARDQALAAAVTTIKSQAPNTKVYLDAGHSTWNSASVTASRLSQAGVAKADGFFSNLSNFNVTGNEISFGKAVLSSLGNPGNLHQVIDTSRNGNGPGSTWCDPTGRALGQNPTLVTGAATVDAFLWVKPPGEADGCAAAAGTFVPSIAYSLALNAAPAPTITPPTTPPTTTPPVTTGSSAKITGVGSGKCVDVPGSATANNTALALWTCNGGTNQKWTTSSSGELRVYTATCLDALNGLTADATPVVIFACNGAAHQKWTFNADGTVRNTASGKCLDAKGAGVANGTALQLWSCNGGGNQKWIHA